MLSGYGWETVVGFRVQILAGGTCLLATTAQDAGAAEEDDLQAGLAVPAVTGLVSASTSAQQCSSRCLPYRGGFQPMHRRVLLVFRVFESTHDLELEP